MFIDGLGGVPPTCMLMDQCKIIRKAISKVIPGIVHYLCIWHIFAKIPKKLKGFGYYYDEAKNDFVSTMLNTLTMDEFESKKKIS